MNQLYFFRARETKRPMLEKNTTSSVLRAVFLISFWVLSICSVRSQTAPNISYATPQNYLLNVAITDLSPTNSGGTVPALTYKQVTTVAGTTSGFLDATGTAAKMKGPLGMVLDAEENVYFIDYWNHRIRRMTPEGIVTTIAGDGYAAFITGAGRLKNDGTGSLASFNYPADLALDTANNCLYVTDKENDVIRKVSLTAPYAVTTFAGSGTSTSTDNTGILATFKKPSGIAIDPTGTYLYVTDRGGNKIRRITISTAQVTTIAGSGTQSTLDNATGTAATFNDPTGIAVDADYIYVTDFGGHKIRKISKTSPYPVSILAGSGTKSSVDNATGTSATFDNPYGMTLDGAGNLFVAEWGNKIRKITPAGVVTTIAGSGVASSLNANGTSATLDSPSDIVFNPAKGFAYISDFTGNRIRKIELSGYELPSLPALPNGLLFDKTTGKISGTPTTRNNGPISFTVTGYNYYGSTTATVSITTGTLPALSPTYAVTDITATSATSGALANDNGISTSYTIEGGGAPTPLLEKGLCWSTSANPTILDSKVTNSNSMTGIFTNNLTGLTPLTTYYVRAYATTALGTGYGAQVSFTTKMQAPVISYNTSNVFTANTAITALQVSSTGGAVSGLGVAQVQTFAGSDSGIEGFADGVGTAALFTNPSGVAADASGNMYVADTNNDSIRKITPDGTVSTFAGIHYAGYNDGAGTVAMFATPFGVATDAAGNVYVGDLNNHKIRKITPAGVVSTLAGVFLGTGFTDGPGTIASFSGPMGVATDTSGNVYVADAFNNRIRKITPAGVVSTLAGNSIGGSADGTGISASFSRPKGVAVDAAGNVYVADMNNNLIRKITPAGVVTTLAGSTTQGFANGMGSAAKFSNPSAVAVDASGNVYVSDLGNSKIRKISPAGMVTTLTGMASFYYPEGIAIDPNGNLYVAESGNNRIRKISFLGYSISPALPAGLTLNADGSITGTPTVATAATDYVVTATNSGGSSSFTIRIAVTDTSATPTWTGTEWINGTASATAPAIIEGNYTSSTHLEVGELTIRNNATVVFQSGHNLTINGKLTVETGSALTMESNANLVQTTNDTNSGAITIKRNTAPLKRLDYVLWSSPVAGQMLQPFSPATLSNRFYTYDGGIDKYAAVSTPSTTAFENGTGYLIRLPNDHPATPTIWTGTFSGVPNNGYLTVTVNTGGYTALGNPYPSTIDADAFIDANSISEALYFWRKTNNAANPSYATYTKAGGVGTANSADPNGLVPNGVIQVGQGFITSVNYIDAVFTNAMRITNNGNQFLKTKKTDKSRIWLNLTNDSGFFSQAMVAYMDGATSGIDAAIDGRYFNDSKTALTSIINDKEFTIQGRGTFDTSDVVPLGFKTETAGDFTLAIDHTDGLFATGQKVFLKDNITNNLHDLSTGSYAFTSVAGVFNTRFEFRYQQSLGTVDNELESNGIVVYKQNDKIKIDAGTQTIAGVKVYDVSGRLLVERKDINANTALVTVNGVTQVLLVQVITQEGSVVIKKIIQ